MVMKSVRHFSGAVAVALLGLLQAMPTAAQFPEKPVTLVVPYGPGSAIDAVARSLANGAQKHLGQSVIVDNKTGAGGALGTQHVARAVSDGYTVGIVSINPFLLSHYTKALAAHPLNDFSHIIRTTGYLMAVAVRADSPHKNINDLIRFAKANPGKLTYSTSGLASTGYLNMEEFSSLAGIQVTHVPYKSGAEANTALLGSHVDFLADAAWAPHEKAGQFRALLVFANERSKLYPQVPVPTDIVKANVQPGYLLLVGPKDLPAPVLKRLHDAFKAAMDEPEHKAVLDKFNIEALHLNSEDTRKAVAAAIPPLNKMFGQLGLGKQ
jgi:tripartite-type tricarboxylate transporter receptor subunit TctC